jgi:general secretion pathway protein B
MSYILEALKKADAERERERAAVPDLHAQPEAVAADALDAARRGRWGWLAAGAALLLAAAAWQWFGDAPTLPQADPAAPLAAPAAAPLTLPMPAAATAAMPVPMPTPTSAATPGPEPAPMPAAAPTAVAPRPPPAPAAMPLPTQVAVRPVVPAAAAPRAATAPKPSPSASAAAEARLYTLAELPPDVRNQLPALAVGGSVYSPAAASRIVILNGQVFREGDRPLDGLLVEQIRLKSTVLAFRGYRIELRH